MTESPQPDRPSRPGGWIGTALRHSRRPGSSTRHRRLGLIALTAAIVLLLGAGLLALALSPTGARPTNAASSVRSRRAAALRAPAHAATARPPGDRRVAARGTLGSLAVVLRRLSIVDRHRPVAIGADVLAPYRGLPTVVWMPAPARRYPLVVFVHGYDRGPLTYRRFCAHLASAGFVVAAPSFPLEDPSRGYGLDRADLPNEATDVAFVIKTVLRGPLAARIEPGRIAVVGHSDGADVSLMVGYQAGKVDPVVRAIVAIAPDPMVGPVVASSRPLLLVQGTADEINPDSNSQQVFAQVPAPRWFLTLVGAGHLAPLLGGTPWTPVLDAAVVSFLDATLGAGSTGTGGLRAELARSPLGRLRFAA